MADAVLSMGPFPQAPSTGLYAARHFFLDLSLTPALTLIRLIGPIGPFVFREKIPTFSPKSLDKHTFLW